jgi:hypothetical protein
MKCSHVALLLTLILTGRAAGALAADEAITLSAVTGEGMAALRLPCLETFRLADSFRGGISISMRDVEPAANAGSPYDTYYTNSSYWGYSGGNSHDEATWQVNADGDRNVTSGEAEKELAIGARLTQGFERGVSWLAANGKTTMGFASRCWQQMVAFVCNHGADGGEVGLDSEDDFDEVTETNDETNAVEAKQAIESKPACPKLVEYLFVTSGPQYDDVALLSRWGKPTIACPWGHTCQSAVCAEYCWSDGEFCANLTITAESAKRWCSVVGDANQGGTAEKQAPVAPMMVARLAQWAKSSLDGWNAAFRNISRQIARLDWTFLLAGQTADRAVRNAAPAPSLIER